MECNGRRNLYNETNVMLFLFNLLKINGLCMFRALLAHPQEALGVLRACCISWLHQGEAN
jgi:hypothetical protein